MDIYKDIFWNRVLKNSKVYPKLYFGTAFQRIARRDKKAFLRDQCKEIEENNRRKIRHLFKKIIDTKGMF